MASLLDIAPLVERVTVRGDEVEVRGISFGDIAYVVQRFPELRKSFGGGVGFTFSAEAVAALGPAIVGAVIACALGVRGDEAEERAAAALALGEQLDLIEAVIRMTAPSGIVPFVEKLTAVFGAVGATGKMPVTN
jgi:hypothetical protein